MSKMQKIAEPGQDNPLNYAVSERDRGILSMVEAALKDGNTLLAFQPIIDARSPQGKVAFYEGLIRVLDESGRIIPAGQFMPVVENQELGREIDCAALRNGLGALIRKPDLRLSINMSARSIGYPKWKQILNRFLAKDASLAERLILEITESSAMQVPEIVMTFMAELQDRGVTFALDDFGAGYTAFRYLKDFYFDIIKIDGQFIRDVDKDPNNQCLTQALITIGQQFDMFTVAEAVETAEEAAFLASIGVDCLQGYYYGAPETKPAWLKKPGGQRKASAT